MLENNKKMCAFYASDYHFEMIILPYLNKKIEENNNVVIFTENNLNDTVNVLMSKMNFEEDRKNKILKLDWKNDDLEKFEELKNYEKDSNDTVVFIKGTENYIKNVNNNINENSKKSKFKIIDCYSVDDIKEDISQIANNYQTILNTMGESKIDRK